MALCFICNARLYGERTRVSSSITPHCNVPYADKICGLMGEDFVVIVTPADLLCQRCTSNLIHMDKLEHDLKLVKNAMLSNVQKKYGLLPAGQPVKSIEVVNGNLRTDDLKIGQRRVPSGLTVKGEPSTSAGGSNASSASSPRPRQGFSKLKIYKCGFCSFQSKELGHVRFHMRSHMRRSENERSNQTVTKTVTQQQPQQQHQNQPLQLMGGVQNKQQQVQQQPFRQQPLQQKKRLYRCQVCSASFDTRTDCLEHIHKDHNQPQQSTAEEKKTKVTTVAKTASVVPHNIQNSIENQQKVKNDEANNLTEDKATMNTDTDLNMLLNDNIPDQGSVQGVQNIPDQAEQLLQVNQEIPTNIDIGDMAIGGGETGTDHLDIESMLAAIHNDISPPNDGANPQNFL